MNEFIHKLQGDRKYSYGILAAVLCLTMAVSAIALQRLLDDESSVSAVNLSLASEEELTGPAAFPDRVSIDATPIEAAGQVEDTDEPEDEFEVSGLAAALGIATTTTTTTTPPTTTTSPEVDESEPAADDSDDSGSEPAPEPAVGEEGYVDTGNGVLVPPVLLKIRFCESRDNYTAKNPRSTAAGGYQFLTGSWAGYGHAASYGVSTADQASPAQQDRAALSTWKAAGTTPWNASKSCWINR